MSITPTHEQEIREREATATPGPWGTYDDGTGRYDIAADLEDTGCGFTCRRQIAQTVDEPIDNDPAHRKWGADEDDDQIAADAAFIAHAREDVPALLAEVERLRSERDRYRIAWRRARTRARSTGGAADRYASRAGTLQTAVQDGLGAFLAVQMERDELRKQVVELIRQRDRLADDTVKALAAEAG